MIMGSGLVEKNKYFQPSLTRDWKPPFIYNNVSLLLIALFCGILPTVVFCAINAARFQINKSRVKILVGCGILAMIIHGFLFAMSIGGEDIVFRWALFFSRSSSLMIWWAFHQQTKKRYMLHEMLGRPTDNKKAAVILVVLVGWLAETLLVNIVKGVIS